MTLMSCGSLSCSLLMAAEKDASEAIRSVVATLPNIQKLKPEQEQSLRTLLVAMMLWLSHGVLEKLDFPASSISD